MKNMKVALVTMSMALWSSLAVAAPTTYEFDTVTGVNMHSSNPSISGVLRNSTTPTTISFVDNTNISYRYVVNRCVPIFLTMMEKPGRYYLNLTVDPALFSVQLISCELTLRS